MSIEMPTQPGSYGLRFERGGDTAHTRHSSRWIIDVWNEVEVASAQEGSASKMTCSIWISETSCRRQHPKCDRMAVEQARCLGPDVESITANSHVRPYCWPVLPPVLLGPRPRLAFFTRCLAPISEPTILSGTKRSAALGVTECGPIHAALRNTGV